MSQLFGLPEPLFIAVAIVAGLLLVAAFARIIARIEARAERRFTELAARYADTEAGETR